MLETNKHALLFKLGEDVSYFVILRYKIPDLKKMDDYFVNDPIKEDFRGLCYYFRSARKVGARNDTATSSQLLNQKIQVNKSKSFTNFAFKTVLRFFKTLTLFFYSMLGFKL